MKRVGARGRWLVAVLAMAQAAGCLGGPAGPSVQPSAVPAPNVSETFNLTVLETNALVRSGHAQSCVLVQSEKPVRVSGHAMARWTTSPPNPASLRFGWYDDDHLASPPMVSGGSPLSLDVNGTAGGVGHELSIFVGATNDTPLVYNQPVSVSVSLTSAAGPVRLYASSCTVN